jgi:hypothetical protein
MIGWALAGLAAGAISIYSKHKQQKAEIDNQKKYAEQAHGYQTAYNQGMYNLQRNESLENLGIAKNLLADAFKADVSGFNLGLEGQALQGHEARIGLMDSTGMALAAQGASGTRGSDALQRRLDYAESSFNRQMDLQDRGNTLALADMTRQYSNQFDDIGREVASWGPGGYKHQANELGRTYAEQMHGLQLQGYKDARDDMNDPMNWIPDYLTGGLGGFGSGANLGGQIDKWWEQMKGSGK